MVEKFFKRNKKGEIFVERKERGITLIALIITIIIMLILVAVTISVAINGKIFKKSGEAVRKTEIAQMMEDLEVIKIIEDDDLLTGTMQEVFGDKYKKYNNVFTVEDGELMYIGTNEETKGYATDLGVVISSYNAEKGCNAPKLMAGMTPIKWVDNVETPTNASDPDWYNYTETDKKWANAKTEDGSYWVWIPRYAYSIPSANYHTSTAGEIQIMFLKNKTNKSSDGTTTWDNESGAGKWNIHPAFTADTTKGGWGTEIPGFWVAKFEASNKAGTTPNVVESNNLQIKPGVASWRNVTISNIFDTCKDAKYGGTTDLGSHLMKNSEWGAVAYLSHSKYGQNTAEVTVNANSSYYTGGGAQNAYIDNVGQSTTGNVTGIYDMSGGAWEYVAAFVVNDNSNLTNNEASLVNAKAKYKDVYTKGDDTGNGNYTANSSKYGDAVYETSTSGTGATSWNCVKSNFPYGDSTIFVRGGYCNNGALAGLFYFNNINGRAHDHGGFRPVLAVL